MGDMRNFAPTDPKQREILQQELADVTAKFQAEKDPAMKEQHARNLIALRRTLAGKSTDYPATNEENPDYVAQASQGAFQPVGGGSNGDFQPIGLDELKRPLDASYEPPAPSSATKPRDRTIVENPGGAATAILGPREARGVTEPLNPSPELLRTVVEGGTSAAGGLAGAAVSGGNPYATMLGAGVGGAGGSLLSELFNPTEKPVQTAIQTGLFAAGAEGTGQALGSGLRYLIGKPNEAGEWLLTAAEKAGHVPPPGAVIPDSALLRIIEGIASADNYMGQKIKDSLTKTNGIMTDEIRNLVNSYMRTKMEADRAFKAWDGVVANRLGDASIVKVSNGVVDSLVPLIKGWEELGLITKLDSNLVKKVKLADMARKDGQVLDGLALSMSEAESARTLLYRAAMNANKSTTTAKKAVAGDDYAQAYKSFGADVGDAIDQAVTKAVRDGRLPEDARATLQGARNLWTKWKQGEAVVDELTLPLQSASREGGPLKSADIYSALDRLAKQGERVKTPLITKDQEKLLSGMARAMEQAENTGKSKAFTWMVRAGQLGVIAGGGIFGGVGGAAGGLALSMTPAAMTWLMTNPKAASFIIRGMKLDANSAEGMRLFRQFATMGMKAGVFPPDGQYKAEEDERQRLELERLTEPMGEQGGLQNINSAPVRAPVESDFGKGNVPGGTRG